MIEIFSNNQSGSPALPIGSELDTISLIKGILGDVIPPSPEGIGDDCSAFLTPHFQHQLLTTDSLTFGQHFDNTVGPAEAGAKLIKRNISDIAAMGGRPGPALLNLLMGADLSNEWLKSFINGIRQCCLKYNINIVGGDVSQLPEGQFTAALSLCGWMDSTPMLRSSSHVGDMIYVTGSLGGSILRKHFAFDPRLEEGQWLAKQHEVTSMMDLTDGLGKDLAAILPENSSASVRVKQLPISEDALICSASDGLSAEAHAFCDGEDYELIFTLDHRADAVLFEQKWSSRFSEIRLSCIGQIIEAHTAGRYINEDTNEALPWSQGFEHFKKR